MPSLENTTLAVFGPGLLGGSLLLRARELGVRELRVYARSEASLEQVKARLGDCFTSTDPVAVAQGADILVLCVEVAAMPALARQLAGARPAAGALFTDVGSVKRRVMDEVAPAFAAAGHTFIGAHPMAGSEKAGFAHADAILFTGKPCILTAGDAPAADVARLRAFWDIIGMRTADKDGPLDLSAADHDRLIASVSHLPHAAAALTCLAALAPDSSAGRYAGNGLLGTTRVASGHPQMWRGIFQDNHDHLLPGLRVLRDFTDRLIAALEGNDQATVLALLEQAQTLRDAQEGRNNGAAQHPGAASGSGE